MKLTTVVFYLRRYLDFFDQYNLLAPQDIRRISKPRFLRAFAKTVIKAKKPPRIAGIEFTATKLRTLTGKSFDALLAVDRKLRFRRNLRVFVGHRFVDQVTRNHRHNLQRVLKPYRIDPVYSDSDMPNSQVFDVILRHIKTTADFCIFDDRETEVRPNVFIELGAAIALGRPYLYFNFRRKRPVLINRTKQKIEIPSDLAGMLRLPYSTYEELFMEFVTRFPSFLTSRNLATR